MKSSKLILIDSNEENMYIWWNCNDSEVNAMQTNNAKIYQERASKSHEKSF